jgi:hypothetical protein
MNPIINSNTNPNQNPNQMQPLQPQNYNFAPQKQKRKLNALLIPLILVTLLMFGAAGFGFWAYAGFTDNKNNVDTKVAAAVTNSKAEIAKTLEAQFLEREKQPYREFQGPAALGSVRFQYPKGWSAYVNYADGSIPVKGYFQPKEVPAVETRDVKYALRVDVRNTSYADSLKNIESQIKDGRIKTTPYENSGEKGVRLDGELDPKIKSVMIMLPLRDKTLRVWTELPEYQADLDNIVLKSLSFSR